MAQARTWSEMLDVPPFVEIRPIERVLDGKAPTLEKVSFDPTFILEQRKREALKIPCRQLA